MFRNALAAALRHLARNRFYAAISVAGLALGFAVALLSLLVVRGEMYQDDFIAGHERIYLAMTTVTPPGRATVYVPSANSFLATQLQSRFSEIEAVTRLFPDNARLTHGQVSASEHVYWADANVFDLLPLPRVAGELRGALARPDTVVLSRSMAHKYFNRDAPLGETLQLEGGAPLTVVAVIEDQAHDTSHLQSGIFISTLSAASPLQKMDRNPQNIAGSAIGFGTFTYLRLKADATPTRLRAALPALAQELFLRPPEGWKMSLRLLRMDELNTDPALNPGMRNKLLMLGIVGIGILAIACINFINLLTARSLRRAPEVGLRKLAGASRGVLVVQFLGESMVYVAVAMLLGVALVELLVPYANAFLGTGIDFSYWREPRLAAGLLLAVLVLGVLAGGWPAFLMSGFVPLRVLKGNVATVRVGLARQALVTLQFAILIGLVISSGVVWQQRMYATSDALRVDTDRTLLINGACGQAFVDALRQLAGVRALGCSGAGLLGSPWFMTTQSREGIEQLVYWTPVSPELLSLYGIKPVAGRLIGAPGGRYYVINQTAARRLGYPDPANAIGSSLQDVGSPRGQTLLVAGVVPDFSLDSVEKKIEPMAYLVTPPDQSFELVSVKLTGTQLPETLVAIDAAWKRTGARDPIRRYFLDEHFQRLYTSMVRAAQLFAAFAAMAVILACFGLFGLAASIAERRTREIGIRKALGAQQGDVLRLLLWQFARPVMFANLIAWPLAGWAMQRWLEGFAYHIDLPVWLFPAASMLALAIALATVSAQALRVATARPVESLRYE